MNLSQSDNLKRIQEKEKERDSFEVQVAAGGISVIDERERNMVISPCCFTYPMPTLSYCTKLIFLLIHAANRD